MAGAAFQVELRGDAAKRLKMLARAMDDLTQPMDEIGAAVQAHVDLSFRAEQDPYGVPWEPLAESTILGRLRRTGRKARGKSEAGTLLRTGKGHTRAGVVKAISSGKAAQILRDTGILANSITRKADKNSVAVGTNEIYAATHQFGDDSRGIPKRPFLPLEGLPSNLSDEVLSITTKYLEQALR